MSTTAAPHPSSSSRPAMREPVATCPDRRWVGWRSFGRWPLMIAVAATFASCASSRARHVSEDASGGPVEHDDRFRRFNDPEKWAAVFDDPERDAWQKPEHVVDVLDLEPGMTVADVGAGTGYFEPHLSRAVGASGAVIAVDVEPGMVAYMRDRFQKEGLDNAEARLGTADDPQLDPYSVDRILIVNTWHHIPARPTYAQRLYDALASGGRLVIVDYTLDSPAGPPRHHRIPRENVIETLESAGFIASNADDELPRQYIVTATKP